MLIKRTRGPHHLVYVAGGAPEHVRTFLKDTCNQPTHHLVLEPGILSPNGARNIGLRSAQTKYVVFLDNDVIVEPGWLEALVRCAEETGADVVGPLCLFGEPENGLIHSAGGNIALDERESVRVLSEKHHLANVNLKTTPVALKRAPCDYVEFHCMLTRRDLFERGGLLDEKILSTGEHMDLALVVRDLGGKTYTETDSVVSYLTDAPYELSDTAFFHQRWCDDWNDPSMTHFASKWRLDRQGQFFKDYESFLVRQKEICRMPRARKAPALTPERAGQGLEQTYPQLAKLLVDLGCEAWECEAVRQAYVCAEALFAGIYRENGKTLVSHVVGTASALAHFGMPISVVVAGLLHPAYTYGRFWGLNPSTLAAQRRWIEAKVGWRTEALIYEITQFDFQPVHDAVIVGNLERLPLNTAYLVLMRIANSIDEHANQGLALQHDSKDVLERNRQALERWGAIYQTVADRMGCPAMLELLRTLHAQASAQDLPPALRATAAGSYEIDPGTGERVPISPRVVREDAPPPAPVPSSSAPLVDRLRSMDVGAEILRIKLRHLRAENKGRVRASRRLADRLFKPETRTLETDKLQWSYSASVRIKPDEPCTGPAVLRMRLHVEHGTVGAGILRNGSNEAFAVPEQGLEPTEAPVTVLIPLPELQEAGRLVFRNWSGSGEPSRMRIFEMSLHQPAQ